MKLDNNEIYFEEFSKNFQIVTRAEAIEKIEKTLKSYEQKYNMSSNYFYESLTNGFLEETFDFGLWKSKIETYCYYKKQIM